MIKKKKTPNLFKGICKYLKIDNAVAKCDIRN